MPYLTVDDYIARFGAHETTILTDEDRTGDYDSEKVGNAISTAEEEANGYIGRRYVIPLTSPPALVKGIIGSLARWYLYANNRPQSVIDDAAIARRQLADISTGKLSIPTAEGVLEESAASKASFGVSGDGPAPIFTEQNLAGFGIPSGYPVANWRR